MKTCTNQYKARVYSSLSPVDSTTHPHTIHLSRSNRLLQYIQGERTWVWFFDILCVCVRVCVHLHLPTWVNLSNWFKQHWQGPQQTHTHLHTLSFECCPIIRCTALGWWGKLPYPMLLLTHQLPVITRSLTSRKQGNYRILSFLYSILISNQGRYCKNTVKAPFPMYGWLLLPLLSIVKEFQCQKIFPVLYWEITDWEQWCTQFNSVVWQQDATWFFKNITLYCAWSFRVEWSERVNHKFWTILPFK